MPTTKLAIVSEARTLFHRLGDRAVGVAKEMVAHLVAIGDEQRAREWREIATAIRDMQREGHG